MMITEHSALKKLGLRRLLVAIDGSPNSGLALTAAITVAQRDNASLNLITIEPDLTVSPASWAIMTAPPPEMQADAHRAAHAEAYADPPLVDQDPHGAPPPPPS